MATYESLNCFTEFAGRIISTKKEDLTKMLDQFSIQVENPLVILNQDTSRNFLNSKSPQDRYRVSEG